MFQCAFTIRSDTRYLGILRQWVAACARLAGIGKIPRRAVLECTLALIEAVDNAIFHAHRRNKDRAIGLSLTIDRSSVVMEVSDEGCGIGRRAEGDPGSMIESGRGLFLIHKLMAKVESRMKRDRHVLRMTYKRF